MKIKKDMSKYYKFVLYLIIVILVNLVGIKLFFRLDLTSNGLYSLSRASKRAVSTLKEPLTVNVFFSKNLPAPYNNIENYLHDMLDEYGSHAKNYLSYRFFDVSAKEGDLSDRAEENRQKAQDYGISPVNVQTIEQDEARVQRAYMGMVFIHGDIIERIPQITSTDGLEYQITSTIQKMNNKISALLNLEEKIRVKLVQSSSLLQIANEINITGLESLKNQIQSRVNVLNGKVYDQLEFVYIDPSTTTPPVEEIQAYERFGLQWPELTREDGSVIPAGQGIMALGLEYGGKSLERQLLDKSLQLTSMGLQEEYKIVELDQIDAFIEDNIDNLINIHDEIGYLSSHGSLALTTNLPPQFQQMQPQAGMLTKFDSLLRNSYSVTQIDLKSEDIPETIDTFIIAGAKEPFSDWELFQIDQFLMKGKSLAIFVETFNEIQQDANQQMYGMSQPVYLPINTGLEKLLDHYGINVKKAYVMDENCFVSQDPTAGEMPLYFAPIIKDENINHRLGFMENIKILQMLKVSPVEIDKETTDLNKLKATQLFSSSRDSWEMAGQINLMPWMIRPPANTQEKESVSLAYLLEGEMPSYFADKPVPEKPKEEPVQEEGQEQEVVEEQPVVEESRVKDNVSVLATGNPGRILVIGSGDILKDNVLDDQGRSPNSVFLLNSLDYLNNREEIAIMRSKNQRFNPLKDTKAGTRTLVKIFNIAGVPILFVLFGFYVWVRRKAKRKMVQNLFNTKAGGEGAKS
ncbi:GldG family protein [Acidobacteriota bacterium]